MQGRGARRPASGRAHGTRFIINHVVRHADELGATIEEEVTRRLLPQLLVMYRRGEPVRFGPVQVSRQGISTDGDLLPWNRVGAVQVLGGLYESIKSTPNLCVLEALIDSLLEGEPSCGKETNGEAGKHAQADAGARWDVLSF